ncbi:hypothetical protein [Photobacterium phosphoreum]|uniref:hypothetical protein n=1 Tax=Photobacterium phosphoreum TaxID=659 RepID=UPI001E4882EB|nr:hypothetical protein [Photobacterium phosphoreum]MCD9475149.1 hypothetical protein [Photobacterium phosphoreum]MCD9509824.1 hypothetical protein [Photobacterium phosphoreum]MCF2175718.1 hypothetical protein [Photobacterium phosphoreum]
MYQFLYQHYRYLILIAVVGVGIGGYYANSHQHQPLLSKAMINEPVTIASSSIEHEIAPIPENFDVLSKIDKEITNAPIPDEQHIFVAQPHHYDEPLMPVMSIGNSPTINSNINLLTGSNLWVYRPHLKEEVELEQQLSLANDATVMQMDDALLNQLVLGDSLILSLPNKGTQQIVIASIQREKNDVIIWGLQNSQRQDIGKITQIREIKEGSFITDDKQEYHLRTVKNKGWIASKDQLIDNNNQAITNNKQPFSEQFLNVK